MKGLSITEASKLAGVTRQTIYNKIDSGEMSKMSNNRIDPSELFRVFPDLPKPEAMSNDEKPEVSNSVKSINDEVSKIEKKYLEEKIEMLEKLIAEKDLTNLQLNERLDKLLSINERLQISALPSPKDVKKRWKFWGG